MTVRRAIFTLVAGRRGTGRAPVDSGGLPTATALVAARDEAAALPGLLEALDRLDYPDSKLEIVVVDDGSRDRTPDILAAWAARGPGRRAVTREASAGKAAAIDDALAEVSGEIVLVYDADERPAPAAPARLAAAFADPDVAAVSGRRRVSNPGSGMWAAYAALEADVHQLVTQRAKDHLDLGPAVLGSNCAYRRADLDAVGGFRHGALLEDSDLTVRLLRAGRRTRFLPGARSDHAVPVSFRGWWDRRTRWSSGFTDVAHDHGGSRASTGRLLTDLELVVFTTGYADRLVAALAVCLWVAGKSTRALRLSLVLAAATGVVGSARALQLADAGPARWCYLATLPLAAPVDVAASVVGMVRSLRGHRRWERRSERGEYEVTR